MPTTNPAIGRVNLKNSGHELRVNSSHRDDHFLYNMGLYFNPGGSPRPPRFSFSQETAIQKYEN